MNENQKHLKRTIDKYNEIVGKLVNDGYSFDIACSMAYNQTMESRKIGWNRNSKGV